MNKWIVFLLLSLLAASLEARPPFIRFENIGLKDGLMCREVNVVLEDKHQILWIGTTQGLTRYDGADFLSLNPHDSLSRLLEKVFVFDMKADVNGDIWIATLGEGLFCYEMKKGRFRNYKHDEGDPLSLPDNQVTQVAFDADNNKWVTTINGLWWLKADGTRRVFRHEEDNEQSLLGNYLYDVLIDRKKHIWVSSPKGVNKFIPLENGQFHIRHYTKNREQGGLPNNSVWAMEEGLDGKIWMTFVVGYITSLDPDTDKLTSYSELIEEQDGLPYSILPDEKGNIWIGDLRRGLLKLDVGAKKMDRIIHEKCEPNSLGSTFVKQIYKSPSGKWIVTHTNGFSFFKPYDQPFSWEAVPDPKAEEPDFAYTTAITAGAGQKIYVSSGVGLHSWDLKSQKWEFIFDPVEELGHSSYKGYSGIFADSKDRIWIGTRLGGPAYWDTRNHRYHSMDLPTMGAILDFKEDKKGNIWMATDGYGLSLFEPGADSLIFFSWPENLGKLPRERFMKLWISPEGNIWIASHGEGLQEFDPVTRQFVRKIKHEDGNANSLANNQIIDIAEDGKGGLWLATQAGVSHFDIAKQQFQHFTTSHGLSSNKLRAILVDMQGKPWVSSDQGIACLDVERKHFRTFSLDDGLSDKDFATREAVKIGDELIFLGPNGLTVFNPSLINPNPTLPKVVLTAFSILNKSAELDQAPEETGFLEIGHRDYAFTFAFSAPSSHQARELRYACKLVGLDEDWIFMGKDRRATYTSLSPGHYTFLAKVWNPNLGQNESDPLEIKLYIRPAFWQTLLFKIMLILLGIGLLLTIVWLGKRQLETRHQKELAEQSAAYKSQFLANMSHEIRTPMHAVLSATELLAESPLDPQQGRYLQHIRQAGNNLLNLINDILDFSKIEAGKLNFKAEPFSLQEVLGYVHKSLEQPAASRNNELSFHIPAHIPDKLVGDPVRLGQILLNLLGNGIKFTENGKVELMAAIMEEERERIILSFQVKDSGLGISEEKLDRIFESFVQGDNQQNLSLAGVGLGLAITKQLVEQQGGRISVQSERGTGTLFSFHLPFHKALADKTQPIDAHASPMEEVELGRILLVEDIAINRELAIDMIAKTFPKVEILSAVSGKQALELLEAGDLPDLILMDVRMPEMDGLTCTRHIRERHGAIVPIVALTASATQDEMQGCLRQGMDGFLAKPFTPDQLTQIIYDILSPLPTENKLSVNMEKLGHFLGHDESRIQRYLSVSRDEIFRHYRTLRLSISQQDWEGGQLAAHSLKTTFRYLGIEQVADRFAAVEKAMSKRDEAKILAALPDTARAVRGYWKSKGSE